jgi:hypothetical protein
VKLNVINVARLPRVVCFFISQHFLEAVVLPTLILLFFGARAKGGTLLEKSTHVSCSDPAQHHTQARCLRLSHYDEVSELKKSLTYLISFSISNHFSIASSKGVMMSL